MAEMRYYDTNPEAGQRYQYGGVYRARGKDAIKRFTKTTKRWEPHLRQVPDYSKQRTSTTKYVDPKRPELGVTTVYGPQPMKWQGGNVTDRRGSFKRVPTYVDKQVTRWADKYIKDPKTGKWHANIVGGVNDPTRIVLNGGKGKPPIRVAATWNNGYWDTHLTPAEIKAKVGTEAQYLTDKAPISSLYDQGVTDRAGRRASLTTDYGQAMVNANVGKSNKDRLISNRAARFGLGFSQGHQNALNAAQQDFNNQKTSRDSAYQSQINDLSAQDATSKSSYDVTNTALQASAVGRLTAADNVAVNSANPKTQYFGTAGLTSKTPYLTAAGRWTADRSLAKKRPF